MTRASRTLTIAIALGLVVLLAGITRTSAQQTGNGESEVQRGFAIAPVSLNLTGKNRSLVGQGSYYVNSISDCVGCHTADGGPYLGGGAPFGPVFSRNLTPDAAGRPAGLSLTQFKDVLHFGADFKNIFPPGPTLIVMPWEAYQYGTERWMEALYEYLRAIPCVEGGPGNPADGRC